MIKTYLNNMINNHKTQMEWKIQVSLTINFVSSKDFKETRIMYTNSNNIDIMVGNETDEIIEELYESILKRYQKGLEEKMRGSEFVYDSINLLHYKLHKISLNRGGSYIDSPEWLKNKKATINPINKKDDNCFQYLATIALNHQQIKKEPQKITKIKPIIDQYDWNEIDFPSKKKDWKKFELNNKSIALNILYVPYNTERIRPAYVSKHNFNRKKLSNSFDD